MSKETWRNLLLVAGLGRNVGKTTLACEIIETFALENSVYAIKITPHFHALDDGMQLVLQKEGLVICWENNADRLKDSGKMLQAGAKKVAYIQCLDEYLPEAISWLKMNIPPKVVLVAESAGLAKYIQPGVFCLLGKNGNIEKNQAYLEKANYIFNDFIWDYSSLRVDSYEWNIKE